MNGCFNLGVDYLHGDGVAQDFTQARTVFQTACDGGYASACSSLGVMYRYGEGVTQDYGQARSFYQKGCDGGDAQACQELKGLGN